MTLLLTALRWCGANWKLLAVAAVYGFGMYVGGAIQQHKQDAKQLDEVKEQLAKNQADNARLNQLEGTKNENLDYVANLYFGLGKSQRLRLQTPTCGQSGETSADSATRERLVPVGISEVAGETSEDAINEFDLRYRNAALRAEKIVEDCRLLNEFNR